MVAERHVWNTSASGSFLQLRRAGTEMTVLRSSPSACCCTVHPPYRRFSGFSVNTSVPLLLSRSISSITNEGKRWRRFERETGHSSGRRDAFTRFSSTIGLPADAKISMSESQSSENQDTIYSRTNPAKLEIAVLGGGLTGLSTAYYLTRRFPDAKIYVIEKRSTLGGWISSKKMKVPGGEVTFEQAVRSVRPGGANGKLMLSLIDQLNLKDEMLTTQVTSPAAQNRFLYYPDHLVRLSFERTWDYAYHTLFKEPLTKGFLRWIINDWKNDSRNAQQIEDESVASFLTRRVGEDVVKRVASAAIHGIYAGNVEKLSAKMVLPALWMPELKYQSFTAQIRDILIRRRRWAFFDDFLIDKAIPPYMCTIGPQVTTRYDQIASIFTFKKGMGQLPEAFEQELQKNKNVRILKSTDATSLDMVTKNKVGMRLNSAHDEWGASGKKRLFDQVISTINPRLLHKMMSRETISKMESYMQGSQGPNRAEPHAVTVMVVNLYFRTPSLLAKTQPPGGLPYGLGPAGLAGFGYLIPSAVPYELNPEQALGVIFDSDISPDLDSSIEQEARGTKLTVMLGGHWWDDRSTYPSSSEAEEMALNVIRRHLGITEEPLAMHATLQRESIPQYEVGHSKRMSEAHIAYLSAFGGHLRVAGSWYTGIGVNHCVRAAYDVVNGLDEWYSTWPEISTRADPDGTGLRQFFWGRPMVYLQHRKNAGAITGVDGNYSDWDILRCDEWADQLGYQLP